MGEYGQRATRIMRSATVPEVVLLQSYRISGGQSSRLNIGASVSGGPHLPSPMFDIPGKPSRPPFLSNLDNEADTLFKSEGAKRPGSHKGSMLVLEPQPLGQHWLFVDKHHHQSGGKLPPKRHRKQSYKRYESDMRDILAGEVLVLLIRRVPRGDKDGILNIWLGWRRRLSSLPVLNWYRCTLLHVLLLRYMH